MSKTLDIREKLAIEHGWEFVPVHDPLGSHWRSPDGQPRPNPYKEDALDKAVEAIGPFDFTLQRRGDQYVCTIFRCVSPMGDDVEEYGGYAAEAVYLAVGKMRGMV